MVVNVVVKFEEQVEVNGKFVVEEFGREDSDYMY